MWGSSLCLRFYVRRGDWGGVEGDGGNKDRTTGWMAWATLLPRSQPKYGSHGLFFFFHSFTFWNMTFHHFLNTEGEESWPRTAYFFPLPVSWQTRHHAGTLHHCHQNTRLSENYEAKVCILSTYKNIFHHTPFTLGAGFFFFFFIRNYFCTWRQTVP